MGLFKKRADTAEMERLRTEIESMSARLAAADAAKQQLDQQVQGIVHRLDTPLGPPPTEPPPKPPPSVDPAEVEQLRSDLLRLSTRVDERPSFEATTVDPAELAQLRGEVGRLSERLDERPEPSSGGVDATEFAEVRQMVERLTGRLDEVDARITSISTELANQISEISNDIEAVGGTEPPTDEVVDELREAQTRLANEQARYQIAFRHDLADLAERLKRS